MSLTAGTINISSYNNGDYDTSTDFTITLAVPIVKARRIRVLAVTIPHLMMPFGKNDYPWTFYVNGVAKSISFPQDRRWTDMTDFVAYCNGTSPYSSALLPTGYTFSYSSATNKLTLTSSTPGEVLTVPGWQWNQPANSNNKSLVYNANYRLGWTGIVSVSGTTSITADSFPNVFNRTNVIYLTSNLSTNSNNDANIGNIIARIPVTQNWGSLIVWENVNGNFSAPVFSETIKDVSIRVLDEDYQVLENPDNAYTNISFGIDYLDM